MFVEHETFPSASVVGYLCPSLASSSCADDLTVTDSIDFWQNSCFVCQDRIYPQEKSGYYLLPISFTLHLTTLSSECLGNNSPLPTTSFTKLIDTTPFQRLGHSNLSILQSFFFITFSFTSFSPTINSSKTVFLFF